MHQQLRTACSQNLLRCKIVAIECQVKFLINIAQKVILEQRRLSSHLTFIEQESIPFNQTTVGSHLSELQLSKHIGYPNAFCKATPTISGYFRRVTASLLYEIETMAYGCAHSSDYYIRSVR